MENLNSLFISKFEPILTFKKFKQKRNVFHRLHEGKIIQLLSIRKFRDSFTIQYGLIPICTGEKIELPLDENRIGDLVGNESLFEWEIDNNIKESLIDAHDKCEKYLYGWFDYVKDYKTYYDFVLKRHEIKLNNLNEEYKLGNSDFLKVPRAVGFYEVCLCLGKYEDAILTLETRLKQIISAEEMNKKYGIQPTEENINKQKELICQINETRNFQKGISSPDKLLKNKEKRTLDSYMENF